ncbi:MAG: SPASM domain-containing protein, partial [Candidatus Latescibacterota bacterium]
WKPALTLFGGEPLLFSRWTELASEIKRRSLRMNVITNGTLLESYAETVVKLGVDELIFSLDGPEDVHNEMRSGKGIFRRAVDSFTRVREMRNRLGAKSPRINISTTIFETNYRRLDEVIATAESIGADAITFHHLIFLSRETCRENAAVFRDTFGLDCNDWIGFSREAPPDIDAEFLIGKLHDLQRRKSPVAITVYPNLTDDEIRRYYGELDFKPVSYADRCISPWTTAYIYPNGDVKPCLDACFIAGNLSDGPFSGIWNNERFREYRRALRSYGSFPACKRCTELYRA